jgi:uncharacterized protein YjbI with pentapeptide repeats
MWIGIGVAANVFAPSSLPEDTRIAPAQALMAGATCMIIPVALVLASGLIWIFFVRPAAKREPATSRATPSPYPASTSVVETSTSSEQAFQNYRNEVTTLLQHTTSEDTTIPGEHTLNIVRAKTLMLLRQIGPDGKAEVLRFLYRTGLLTRQAGLSLVDADLQQVSLRFESFRGINLSGANLRRVDLQGSDLSEATLRETNLVEADLRTTNLEGAVLDLATLQHARLHKANLHRASLRNAHLDHANLWAARMQATDVMGANFRDTNLTEATVTDTDLRSTASLAGAIMPDGTRHM